jgi:hypothetical protein
MHLLRQVVHPQNVVDTAKHKDGYGNRYYGRVGIRALGSGELIPRPERL